MLVVGAKGHAKEILDLLAEKEVGEICFFDNVNSDLPEKLFGLFPILRNENDVVELFANDNSFALGTGGTSIRSMLYDKFVQLGGYPNTVISKKATISKYGVNLELGLNIMHNVLISNEVYVGKGTLLNAGCAIHHGANIGSFCEISPGAIITGDVTIGDFTAIGSGAIVLPKLKVGKNVIVGAGAVVTCDLEDNALVVGVPAKDKYKI